ncbi:MAG: S8 family serine peptidase [Nitrospirota bacterium]
MFSNKFLYLRRFAVFLLVLMIAGGLFSHAMAEQPSSTSSLIIRMVSGLSAYEQAAVIHANGGTETSSIPALRLHVVEVQADQLSTILENYQSDPRVESAAEDKIREVQGMPADPDYGFQWALSKIGWDLVYGILFPWQSSKVAILDTGVQANHEDLAANVIMGRSFLDDSHGLSDSHGHGTWLAGIIAAITDNNYGIAGIGLDRVKIMPVTVMNADGTGQDSDIISGIIWAADNGADVILMGFSNPGFSPFLQEAVDYAWSKNVVLVAATGNEGISDPTFPAGARGVIGVSATDYSDNLASFSNFGQSVFLAAPGEDIATTGLENSIVSLNGTSASAAIVAGVAAFMKADDPTLTNGVIVGRLARTADPAGTHEQTGNGRVNMAAAMADTGLDEIQPAGVEAGGGPYVGPYKIAASISGATTTIYNYSSNCPPTTSESTSFILGSQVSAKSSVTVTGGGTAAYRMQWYKSTTTFDSSTLVRDTVSGNLSSGTNNVCDSYTPVTAASHTVLICKTGNSGACAPGNIVGSATYTVNSLDPTKLAFTSTVFTRTVGECSPQITVQTQDASNTPTNPTSNMTVNLSSSSGGGTFYSDASCTSSITSVTILSTGNTASFYYKDLNAGAPTITASATGLTSANQTETINKADQTITFGTLADRTYGDAPFAVSATASSSLTVAFSSLTAAKCTVSGTTVTIVEPGTCTIRASQAGNANYNAASDVDRSFAINKKSLTVIAHDKNRIYGEPNPALSGSLTGVVNGDGITASYSTTATQSSPVGTYTITPSLHDPNSKLNNYSVTIDNGALTIDKRPTTLVYQGQSAGLYSDCVRVSARLTDDTSGSGIAGKTINFMIGAATASAVTDANGVAATGMTLSSANMPGTYQVSVSFGPDDIYSNSTTSQSFTINAAKVGPLAGQAVYTGNVFFWTTVTTNSNTVSLALSATIQDVDQVCTSDIRNARVTFAIRNSNGLYTPINGAANLPVGLVNPDDRKVGTASAIVQYNMGNAYVTSLDIAVIVGGGYLLNNPVHDTIVTVAKPLDNGWIIGGGKTTNGTDSRGYIAGAAGQSTDFSFDVKYNKSGANPQGAVNITVRSYYKPDGSIGNVLRTYKIKSTAIAVLTVQKPSGTASFSSKANLVDITDPANSIAIEGGAQLQIHIKDGNQANGNGDTIAMTLQRKAGGVWFSSKWSANKTVPMPIAQGDIVVK